MQPTLRAWIETCRLAKACRGLLACVTEQACTQEGSDAPVSFRNSEAVAGAQEQGCALADLTHGWGRLRVTGRDALSFLHQQSTADFKALQPGQGCRTVRIPCLCLVSR